MNDGGADKQVIHNTRKTLAQTARGMLQGALILVLASVLFGVTIHGSILLGFWLMLYTQSTLILLLNWWLKIQTVIKRR